MYKGIIIDDERKICDLIMKLGNWKELNIEIIDICSNGEDALDSIMKNRPDIVLTDIRMPVYDGIELVRILREHGMDTEVIMISGHREFEYAHNAIQYGVTDFLVKPINKELLHTALKKVCVKLEERKNEQHQKKQMKQLLEVHDRYEKEEMFNEVWKIKGDLEEYEQEEQEEKLEEEGNYTVLLIRTTKANLNEKKSVFATKVIELVELEFKTLRDCIAVSKKQGVFVILNYEKEQQLEIYKKVNALYKQIQEMNYQFQEFQLTIAIGKVVTSFTKLYQSIETTKIAWNARIWCSRKDIIEYQKLQFHTVEISQILSKELLHQFESGVENMQSNQVADAIKCLEKMISGIPFLDPTVIAKVTEKMINQFLLALRIIEDEKVTTCRNYFENNLLEAETIAEYFTKLRRCFLTVISNYYEQQVETKNSPIKEAKLYIQENYSNQLTMEEVAAHVNLSSAYFSKLFKNVEGKNYIDFLTEVRVHAAKIKLRNTRDTIESIAREVGYQDEKYFWKTFKKITGIKPTDYRKLY